MILEEGPRLVGVEAAAQRLPTDLFKGDPHGGVSRAVRLTMGRQLVRRVANAAA